MVGALRATTEAGEARGRLRRPLARRGGGLVNKFPVRQRRLAPAPGGAFLAFAGHGSPPFRRDTELHGKFPCRLEINAAGHWSSKFPWDSVSPRSGLPCRVAAMQRIAEAVPWGDACLHANPPVARRARAQPRAATRFRGRAQRPAPHPLRLRLPAFSALKPSPALTPKFSASFAFPPRSLR